MNEEHARLEALQKIDVVIVELEEKLNGLSGEITELETRLTEKREKSEETLKIIKQNETKRSDLEKMLFLEQDRLKKTRGKLQGTGVRNPHAFSANQREIDKVKKDIESLETELLKIMEEIESSRAGQEQIETEFSEAERALEESRKNSVERSGELEAKKSELLSQREKLVADIDPKTMAIYNKIQGRYPKNAVVMAKDESCMGCHMNIPPQLYNEIQRGEKLISCPACHRILLFYSSVENDLHGEVASG